MRIITIITASIFFTLFISFNSKKKVKFIYIKRELDFAKVIQIGNSNDTLILKSKRGGFLNVEKINTDLILPTKEIAGSWPSIGQNVLMVIDKTNSIKLFAFKLGNYYRFWDPNSGPFANSIFFIPKEKTFKRLPVCLQITDDKNDYWNCTDGCLVDATSISYRN
jgi:hypothetical protein